MSDRIGSRDGILNILPSIRSFEVRPSWGRHLEFIITCVGFAVGLGNIWRFPHLVYRNGGGAFLIPYVISLFCIGIPLFCLEILFGQFSSLGPITAWYVNVLFKGLGYTMVVMSGLISVYYNIIVSVAFFYMFASFQSHLPWTTCDNRWNTCYCRRVDSNLSLLSPAMVYDRAGLNCSDIEFNKNNIKSPSEEYYANYVLDLTQGIFYLGKIKWDLTLCNLLGWLIICVALIKGVKTMGKCVYFFATFPYVILTVLLVKGLTLKGSRSGISYYLTPNFETLKDSEVWKSAASQIFFSLGCCSGSLTAMASYNDFHNNALRDSFVMSVFNCLTSFYAGFAIFSILGYMSEATGVPIREVSTSGQGLVFVAYPQALALLPAPQFWSFAFFFMLVCLGLGTQFPSVETVLTALQDEFEYFRRKSVATYFRICTCVVGFLLGLPMTTQGGMYIVELLDVFVGLPLLLIGFLEIFAIVWVYGHKRLAEDVELMVGHSPCAMFMFRFYYAFNWYVVSPVLLLAIIVFECVRYQPITSSAYPVWAELLGWLVVVLTMVWTPLWYLVYFWREWRLNGYRQAWQTLVRLNQPTDDWGPYDDSHRTILRYIKPTVIQPIPQVLDFPGDFD